VCLVLAAAGSGRLPRHASSIDGEKLEADGCGNLRHYRGGASRSIAHQRMHGIRAPQAPHAATVRRASSSESVPATPWLISSDKTRESSRSAQRYNGRDVVRIAHQCYGDTFIMVPTPSPSAAARGSYRCHIGVHAGVTRDRNGHDQRTRMGRRPPDCELEKSWLLGTPNGHPEDISTGALRVSAMDR